MKGKLEGEGMEGVGEGKRVGEAFQVERISSTRYLEAKKKMI